MDNFASFKKFLIIFDIIVIPLLIYQSVVGTFPIAEWITIIIANVVLFILNKRNKNNNYY